MTSEKLSYIVASLLGLGSILGAVWMMAVATNNLGHKITDMGEKVSTSINNYELLAKNNLELIKDVKVLKQTSMQVVYVSNSHIIVRMSDGVIARIPMEHIDASINMALTSVDASQL